MFDVSALTKDGDIQLVLSAFATHIQDSLPPTSMHAALPPGGALKINSVTARPAQFPHNDGNSASKKTRQQRAG